MVEYLNLCLEDYSFYIVQNVRIFLYVFVVEGKYLLFINKGCFNEK